MKYYESKFTGSEVDDLLTRVKEGKDVAKIREELNKKANTEGYYRNLEVGYADGLKGHEGEATYGIIGFRETAGENNSIEDGSAEIKTIYGDSVVWNNLYGGGFYAQQSSISENGNLITITPSGEFPGIKNDDFSFIVGHKYICIVHRLDGGKMYINAAGNYDSLTNVPFTVTPATRKDVTIYTFGDLAGSGFVITRPQIIDLTLMFGAGNEPTTIEEYEARKPIVEDEYAYNEGEVVGVNPKGIKSVGDNVWNEEWENGYISTDGEDGVSASDIRSKNFIQVLPNERYYFPYYLVEKYGQSASTYFRVLFFDIDKNFLNYSSLYTNWGEDSWIVTIPSNCHYIRFYTNMSGGQYNNDITISLYHSGWKNGQYEPYVEDTLLFGLPDVLHKWDRAYNKNGKGYIVKGMGVVDMGIFDWGIGSTNLADKVRMRALTKISDATIPTSNANVANILCKRYIAVSSDKNWQNAEGICIDAEGYLYVYDGDIQDTSSLKASLQGVMLYYELAEPEVIEYEPAFSNTYKAWDFGTEELLVDGPSCPMPCDIIYSFNALDTIRGNKFKNEEQDSRLLDLERRTVKRDSYAPDLTSGFADNLVGRGESTPAEFSFRASGGKSIMDGAARIKTLCGNAVVWNNMVDTRDKVGISGWVYENDFLHLVQGHKYAMLRSKAMDALYCIPVIDGAEMYDYVMREGTYAIIFTSQYDCTPSNTKLYSSQESDACCLVDLTLMFGAGDEPSTIEEYEARKPIVEDEYAYNEGTIIPFAAEGIKSVGDNALNADRSLVFDFDGSYGNYDFINTEDAFVGISADGYINGWTIDYAEKIEGGFKFRSNGGGYGIGLFVKALPNEEYSVSYTSDNGRIAFGFYDKGKNLISYESWENRFTTPSNCEYIMLCLRDNEVVNIDISFTNIMLTLVHSGWKQDTDAGYQPYWADTLLLNDPRIAKEFPNGMMPWDKVYNKNGKGYIVKGTGKVDDMASMAWETGFGGFHSKQIKDSIKGVNGYTISNVLCSRLATGIVGSDNMGLYVIYAGEDYPYNKHVRIIGYDTLDALKASLAGVPLYYELAEPTIIEYDEPFNFDYEVADFGTEQIISEKPSAPIKADIIYQFNAVDMIRENYNEIQQLKTMIATMQAQMASLINKE